MKCLIVDDEFSVRRSLVMMGRWKDLGISQILEAPNGLAAMEIAERERPGIILTDMRMNTLDGTGFLRALRELPYTPEVIVISGYSDYEYMHSALQNQAVDYVLKPVSEDVLNRSVQRAIDRLLQREGSLQHSLDAFIRQMNERLVLHDVDGHNLMDIKIVRDFVDQNQRLRVFVPLPLNFDAVCRTGYRNLTDLLCMKMQQLIESAFADADGRLLVLRVKGDADWDFICLLGDEMPIGDEALDKRLHRALGALGELGLYCAFGRDSGAFDRQSLIAVHGQVRSALMHADLLTLAGRIVVVLEGKAYPAAKRLFASHEAQLTQHILHCGYNEAGALVDQVFLDLKKRSTFSVNQLQSLAMEFFEIVSHMMAQYAVNPGGSLPLSHIWRAVFENLGDIDYQKALFKRYFDQACGLFAPCANGQRILVGDVLKYIEAHYGEKLPLSDLSAYFFVSREHLSRLLRQETGKTFTDHITETRLQHVRRLLLSTNLPLSTIAEQTGFIYPSYLNRVFRRAYGITPMEYRAGEPVSIQG